MIYQSTTQAGQAAAGHSQCRESNPVPAVRREGRGEGSYRRCFSALVFLCTNFIDLLVERSLLRRQPLVCFSFGGSNAGII